MGISDIKYRDQSLDKIIEVYNALPEGKQQWLLDYAMCPQTKEQNKHIINQ